MDEAEPSMSLFGFLIFPSYACILFVTWYAQRLLRIKNPSHNYKEVDKSPIKVTFYP